MKKHLQTGKAGEALAVTWLAERGYTVLHRNWRNSYYEIDIIAPKEGVLHFIEVKARKSDRFGYPEEAVDRKKLHRLMKAAEAFLEQYPEWKKVQYDVIAIRWESQTPLIELFEDLYPW